MHCVSWVAYRVSVSVHRVYVCFILYHCIIVPRPLLEGKGLLALACVYTFYGVQ